MSGSRQDVVTEARRWVGTPYHDRGRICGVGVDCAMLPAEVYHAVGLIPLLEMDYSPQWYQHRDEELFLDWVRPHAREIPREQLAAGDFVIWRFGRTFSHGAIVVEPPVIIHALVRGRAVIEDNMDISIDLVGREALYFTLWDDQ